MLNEGRATALLLALAALATAASCTPADGPASRPPAPAGQVRSADDILWEHGRPRKPLGRVDRATLRRVLRTDISHTLSYPDLDATLLTELGSPRQARTAAAELARLLPPGASHYGPRDAVVAIGRVVAVRGVTGRDSWRRVRALLARYGGRVSAEDDHLDAYLAADLTCRPPSGPAGRALAVDLADFSSLPNGLHVRPPWVGPPLTDAERRARSTYRRLATALVQTLQTDEGWGRLANDYAHDLLRGDHDAAAEDLDRMTTRADEVVGDAATADMDLRVLALMLQPVGGATGQDPAADRDREAGLGALMGQYPLTLQHGEMLPPRDAGWNRDGWIFAVRLGRRLELSGIGGNAFLSAWSALLLHLDRHGCDDVRAELFIPEHM